MGFILFFSLSFFLEKCIQVLKTYWPFFHFSSVFFSSTKHFLSSINLLGKEDEEKEKKKMEKKVKRKKEMRKMLFSLKKYFQMFRLKIHH